MYALWWFDLEYVKPEKLDLYLAETITAYGTISNEFTFVTFDGNKLYQAIRSGIYYAENFELGCEFCGSVIRECDDCHNCGGVRLPFTELVRLDHRCLYCGNKVKGNLWCNSCGASISGTKFFGGGKF